MSRVSPHVPRFLTRTLTAGRPAIVVGKLLAVLWLTGLAACARDPLITSLSFSVPAKYGAEDTAKPAALDRWWTAFRSLELDRLVALGNADNLDLAIAVAQLDAAEAQIAIAGASFWPNLSFNDANVRSQSAGGAARNAFSRSLGASYFLDVWGRNRAQLDAAVHSASASGYQVDVVRRAVTASVVESYLVHVASTQRIATAKRNLANAERVLAVILDRIAAGTASEFERVQQAALIENQRAALPSLVQTTDTARIALALALGKPGTSVQADAGTLLKLRVPAVGAGVPSALLTRRPDIRAAEETLAAAHADVHVARTALFPSITLSASTSLQASSLSALLSPQTVGWSIGANVVQLIFDGGRTRALVALSEAQRRALLENYRRSILIALTDVETALIAVRESAAREKAQERALQLARRAFQLGEERLRQGTIDLTSLLATQNTLFQSEDAMIQARLARLQAIARLCHALGGSWDEK